MNQFPWAGITQQNYYYANGFLVQEVVIPPGINYSSCLILIQELVFPSRITPVEDSLFHGTVAERNIIFLNMSIFFLSKFFFSEPKQPLHWQKGDGKFRKYAVVIWVQLHIFSKNQTSIRLNPNHNCIFTESFFHFYQCDGSVEPLEFSSVYYQ
jgi:hypothetical protein